MKLNNRLTRSKKMRALEILCSTLQNELDSLERDVRKLRANMLTIDDAKKRDYIVRTNYIGKVKDDALIKDFKNEIETTLDDKFDNICQKLLNYQLIDLYRYREILNNYELKQIVLDTYKK